MRKGFDGEEGEKNEGREGGREGGMGGTTTMPAQELLSQGAEAVRHCRVRVLSFKDTE